MLWLNVKNIVSYINLLIDSIRDVIFFETNTFPFVEMWIVKEFQEKFLLEYIQLLTQKFRYLESIKHF